MNSLACVQGINSMLYNISHSLYCINVHSSQQVPNDNLAKPPRLISSYRHLDKPKMNSTFIFIRILILIISILCKIKSNVARNQEWNIYPALSALFLSSSRTLSSPSPPLRSNPARSSLSWVRDGAKAENASVGRNV